MSVSASAAAVADPRLGLAGNMELAAVREESLRADAAERANAAAAFASELTKDSARTLARSLLDRYFRTVSYPYTRHHIDSFDQFLSKDLPAILKNKSPLLLLKDLIDEKTNTYAYRVEIYVGGLDGTKIEIGAPTVSLQNTQEVRLLFPNEARLRNLTYASMVYVDIDIKLVYTERTPDGKLSSQDIPIESFRNFPLFKIPIMLHSRYCVLNGKNKEFLRQAGECPYDNGGYFIIEGAEKVLITRQEAAFNTLYIANQERDMTIQTFASITCLSPETRVVKRVAFALMRKSQTIEVTLPFVRKAIPLFVLFRALGFQSDEEILRIIFPDFDSFEAKLLMEKLIPSILDARPFVNTNLAVQYIKTLTKGFGVEHVIDILRNQFFIHMEPNPANQAVFLGDCVRKILRVAEGIDRPTNRDDTRNQRCLVSGFLVQTLFSDVYKLWLKSINLAIGREFENHRSLYSKRNFANIFSAGNGTNIFRQGYITDGISRGFKGKWGSGLGEEKTGVLQALSRLSYCDFMSHCRRVILDFDTSMKLTGPRHLAPSQYGYFCTSETPTGGSIGITKNLSILTAISTASEKQAFINWLRSPSASVFPPEILTDTLRATYVPVYINGGMFGYTQNPVLLVRVLKTFKRTGCLPYSVSVSFSIRDRIVYIFLDEGRPMRPLVVLDRDEGVGELNASKNRKNRLAVAASSADFVPKMPLARMKTLVTWRDLVFGSFPGRSQVGLDSTDFHDPLAGRTPPASLVDYLTYLEPVRGVIEYVDPYEQNECFIANYPDHIIPQTTHVEVHPSTITGLMTSLIPFPNHNQSPRNQLSCSQSKQGLSYYATNFKNRFDNTAHVLCYGEAPLVRTLYMNYLGEGQMPYGSNCVLAIMCWTGYNQEDNLVINGDAIARGLFHNITYRSYEAFEEDDDKTKAMTRFGNPGLVGEWKDLRPGLDYSKLDNRGIVRVGEYVDESTVIVGAYTKSETGIARDSSVTPQVWTRGRVEDVVVTVNNQGLRLVKIRVVQNRTPELGDKFSNRHGQKGTIGAILRGHDLPRTRDGIVPDLIMNPHAIPSRMTIAQNIEQLVGKAAPLYGAVADGTAFMNDGSPEEAIGKALEAAGYERYGNELLYNGATGEQIQAAIFIGPIYGMRLKHMVEDKWQARSEGRREQRTHQPTGGRGNQGGLKIGEQERDALVGHSVARFLRESFMKRSDGTTMILCASCGTIPIYNPKLQIAICPLCDGPVKFAGSSTDNLEILPPIGRARCQVVKAELPYATKLLGDELSTFLNMGMRVLTTKDVQQFRDLTVRKQSGETTEGVEAGEGEAAVVELRPLILKDTVVPEFMKEPEATKVTFEQLQALGAQTATIVARAETESGNDIILDEEAAVESLPVAQQLPQVVNVVIGAQPQALQTMAQPPQQLPIVAQSQEIQNIPIQFEPVVSAPQAPQAPQAVILPSPLPTQQGGYAPQTIVVDTSPMVMMQPTVPQPPQSFQSQPQQRRLRFAPSSASQPRFRQNIPQEGGMIIDDPEYRPPSNSTPRVMVRKIE